MSIRCWIPAGILVLGIAGCGGAHEPAEADKEHSEKEEAHVTVRTEPAKRGALVEAVEGLGPLRGPPRSHRHPDPRGRGARSRVARDARRPGQERPADRQAGRGGRAGRPGREDGHARRAQSVAGPAQVAAATRGAEGQRAGGRAGQGGGRACPGPRRRSRIAPPGWQPDVEAAGLRRREGPGGGPAPAAVGRGAAARR